MRRLANRVRTPFGVAAFVVEHFTDDSGVGVEPERATRFARTWYGLDRAWLGEEFGVHEPGEEVPPAETLGVEPFPITAAAGDDDTAPANQEQAHWVGPIAWENVPTGDSRVAEPGAWRWETPVGPLRWAETDEGQHQGARVVGTIMGAERQGDAIQAWGTFDLGSAHGREAARLVDEGVVPGVSVDPDEVSMELRIAGEVWDEDAALFDAIMGEGDVPEPERDADGNVIVAQFTPDDEVLVFTDARIRGATMVDIPAFREANITLTDVGRAALEQAHASLVAAALEDVAVGTAVTWGDDMAGVVTAVDEDAETVTVQPDDEDADEVTMPVADVTVAQDDDEDDDEDGPPLLAAVANVPVDPPAAWFQVPEPDEVQALSITDDGLVTGHLAVWGTCHTGMANDCVQPPDSPSGYAHFHTGSLRTADGTDVAVGHLTMDTGHANTRARARPAAAHYDDTGAVFADVRAIDGALGIWISGALRPGLSEEQLRRARSAPLSGDWRAIGGNLELIAALSVNAPGFPVPRTQAMVAAGDTVALVAAGMVATTEQVDVQDGLTTADLAHLRRVVQRERDAEARRLRLRVHGGADGLADRLHQRVHRQ